MEEKMEEKILEILYFLQQNALSIDEACLMIMELKNEEM